MTTKATHISRFFSTEDVANGTISVAKLSNIYTSNVIEHVNLYFTTQRARDSFSAGTGVSILDGNISIGQPVYTNNSVSFNNLTLTGELRGPSTLVLDPAAIGDDTGTVQIRGNLQVDGTTTTINSTTLTVDDLNIVLAQGAANAAAASGAGISIDGANATLTYASSTDTWNINKNLLITPGTANGVLYLNGSKVATTGSVLTFDGNQLAIKSSGTFQPLKVSGYGGSIDTYFYTDTAYWAYGDATGLGGNAFGGNKTSNYLFWQIAGSERMRLNTTGLGIGTNSPSYPLSISTTNHGQYAQHRQSSGAGVGQEMYYMFNNASGTAVTYASVYVELAANTAGSHGGKLGLRTAQSGTLTTAVLIDSSGRVGINENNPSLPLHIAAGTNGYPNSSGTTEVGFLTLRRKSAGSTHGLWMGVADASPWGSWLQAADAANFATNYPLLLNPRGGQVIIGGTSTYGAGTVALYVKGGTSGWAVFERSSKSLFVNANYSDLNTAAQVSTQAIDSMNLSLSARETLSDLYLTTNGNVGVGTTSPGTLHKLAVEGPSRIKRLQKQIYNFFTATASAYLHVKTNLLLASGGQVGMWVWRLYGYYYGAAKIIDAYYALHSDASGTIYSNVVQNRGNFAFGTGMYKSSDNYLVLVGFTDYAYYFGFDVDVQHMMNYTYSDLSITATAQSASSTGAF